MDGLELNSGSSTAPLSAQPSEEFDKLELLDAESSIDIEDFDLHDFTREEVDIYNSMAEPGQRLQDAVTPNKMKGPTQDVISRKHAKTESTLSSKIPSIRKQVVHFVRSHPFLEKIMGRFMKSDRRRFERDVYDYAEALGLDHRAAKKQVIKARGFCGEEDYDSENSALGDEVDDSADILKRLGSRIWSEPKVLPSVEDAHTGQAESRPKSKTSPKKSPYFSADSKTTTPQKKRKANPDTEDGPEGKESLSHGSKGLKRTKHGSIGEEINASKTVDSERASKERNDSHITTACGASQGLENGAIVDFSDYKLTAQPQAAIESREPHVNDTKAARKAAKKARRTQERAKRDPQGKASHKDRISALEPKTEAEAHENWLRLNQQDPHEHGPALNQREEESAEKAKSGAAFVEKLSDDIRYVNEKQLQLYGQGGMKNEKQGIKDDLEDMKRTRDELKPADEQVQRSKGRKRKSAAIRPDDDQAHSRNAQNTSNANSTSMVHGKNSRPKTRKQAKEDF